MLPSGRLGVVGRSGLWADGRLLEVAVPAEGSTFPWLSAMWGVTVRAWLAGMRNRARVLWRQ